jgi:hypothetical protein
MDWMDLLGFVFDLCEAVGCWRFLLCVGAAVGVAVLVCARVESRPLRVVLAGPVVLGGIATGSIWESRKR